MSQILTWLEKLNLNSEPTRTIILALITTILIITSVIIIGVLIEKLEQIEMKILSKFFGIKLTNFICNRLTFIGVIVHEYSHALFATLAGAKVTEIKCFEFNNYGRLGHVTYTLQGNRVQQALQYSLCSCAPVVTGLTLESILLKIMFTTPNLPTWSLVLIWYLFISVLNHMSMSSSDIKNYCKGLWIIAPVTFIISALVILNI